MNVENFLFNIPSQKILLGHKRTKELLQACGSPQKYLYTIQIVGTNGKGSTASLLANAISTKYKTGLFTSPHLLDFKERIQINHKKITDIHIEKFLKKYKNVILAIQPSFFEIMTVLAVWHFAKNKVDIGILETGLGGKLDSVTACENNIVAYTNISIDHQSILGDSIQEITKEKAGAIVSKNQTVFSVKQKLKVEKVLYKYVVKNKFFQINPTHDYKLKYLKGKHQQVNASLAEGVIKFLAKKFPLLKKNNVKEIFLKTKWPGRFEIICKKPIIIFDVAHNDAGILSFQETLSEYLKSNIFKTKYLICGFEHNKNIKKSILQIKDCFDKIICTETGIRKSMDCSILAKIFQTAKAIHIQSVEKALKSTIQQAQSHDLICVMGSHFFGPHLKKYTNVAQNNSFASLL